jgi:hypothetical protein
MAIGLLLSAVTAAARIPIAAESLQRTIAPAGPPQIAAALPSGPHPAPAGFSAPRRDGPQTGPSTASHDVMPSDALRLHVARNWLPHGPLRVARVFGAGLSGADVSLVERTDGGAAFVLKRFASGADRGHAEFVHRLVRHVAARVETRIAVLEATPAGETLCEDEAGALWELSRFVKGVTVAEPDGHQAAAAAVALARLHEAAATLPGHALRSAVPRSIVARRHRIAGLVSLPWSRLAAAGRPAESDLAAAVVARAAIAEELLADRGGAVFLDRAAAGERHECLVQPVLRDVWYEHVLFAGQRDDHVTGFIDAHAAGIDAPATDIARLLGSWRPRGSTAHLPLNQRWPDAWRAYAERRALPTHAARLVQWLHATGIVIGLDNWFRWTLEEGRRFSDTSGVLARIDSLLAELPHALAVRWFEIVD